MSDRRKRKTEKRKRNRDARVLRQTLDKVQPAPPVTDELDHSVRVLPHKIERR